MMGRTVRYSSGEAEGAVRSASGVQLGVCAHPEAAGDDGGEGHDDAQGDAGGVAVHAPAPARNARRLGPAAAIAAAVLQQCAAPPRAEVISGSVYT